MRLINWIESYLSDEDEEAFRKLYEDHEDLFHTNPGSSHNHQTWPGGLADHLTMMCELAYMEYIKLSDFSMNHFNKRLPFSFSSALKVILLHDAEKVIVYGDKNDPRCKPYHFWSDPTDKETKEKIKFDIINQWMLNYKFTLSDAEWNAIIYTHGEGDDYRNDKRVMNELAAFVGNIDRTSARIFHSDGKGMGA